jgi:hypothetical protein
MASKYNDGIRKLRVTDDERASYRTVPTSTQNGRSE